MVVVVLAVLNVTSALTKTIQVPTVLSVINLVLKEHLSHFEESSSSQKAITSSLMLRSNSLYLKLFSNFLQATFKILTALHQILDVIDIRKVDAQKFKEFHFLLRQVHVRKYFQHVTKVIAAVK